MAVKQGELVPQIFKHPEFGEVRVTDNEGDVWYVGRDVATSLGYAKPADAVRIHVPDKYKGVFEIETPGGKQKVTFINEAGVYKLVLKSKMPKAEEFSDWLCADVAPSIRKTGVYMTTEAAEEIISNPDFIIGLAQQVKRARAERDAALKEAAVLSMQVAELQPKANYYDLILNCKDLVSTSKIAKDYGMSAVRFNRLLKSLGVQYNQSGVWLLYQEYAGQGWSSTKTHNYLGSDSKTHCKVHTYWTQKGRRGLYDLLKKNGHLPTVERED